MFTKWSRISKSTLPKDTQTCTRTIQRSMVGLWDLHRGVLSIFTTSHGIFRLIVKILLNKDNIQRNNKKWKGCFTLFIYFSKAVAFRIISQTLSHATCFLIDFYLEGKFLRSGLSNFLCYWSSRFWETVKNRLTSHESLAGACLFHMYMVYI